MEARNAVTAVVSGQTSAAADAAAPRMGEREVAQISQQRAQRSEETEANIDAVAVDLASNAQREIGAGKAHNEVQDKKEKTEEEEAPQARSLSREEAEEAAKKLEEMINFTSVKFKVNAEEVGGSAIHFQVIDRGSGEIIHEFPPEDTAKAVKEMLSEDVQAGIVVDKAV